MANYSLLYRDPNGVLTTVIKDFFKLEYARKENDFGSLYLDVPPVFGTGFFKIDGQLEIQRTLRDDLPAYLEGETTWFIRKITHKTEGNRKWLHLLAYDAVHMLERRVIPYYAESAYTKKADYADDMIKAIVRENMGTLAVNRDTLAADTARNLSALINVEVDESLAPLIEKSFAWRKVLPTLQEIAQDSRLQGTYLAFDVVQKVPNLWEFRTYTGQRGINRGQASGNAFNLSIENDRLNYVTLSGDYTREITYVYCGGQGEGNDRNIQEATDVARATMTPFNRIEDFVDARDNEKPETVLAEANARLREMIPKYIINGHVLQTPSSIYGRDYNFGDIVVVKYMGMTYDVHLDGIHVTVENSGGESIENIEIFARNYEDTDY